MEEEDTAECSISIGETLDDWVRSVRGIMLVNELVLRGPFLTGPSTQHSSIPWLGIMCFTNISPSL